jgi:hypothetical protein
MGLYSPAGEYRKNIPPYQFSIFSNFGLEFKKEFKIPRRLLPKST